jgi:hypothetical protein
MIAEGALDIASQAFITWHASFAPRFSCVTTLAGLFGTL